MATLDTETLTENGEVVQLTRELQCVVINAPALVGIRAMHRGCLLVGLWLKLPFDPQFADNRNGNTFDSATERWDHVTGIDEADQFLVENNYQVDSWCNKRVPCNLDPLLRKTDATEYDTIAGKGTFQRVVNHTYYVLDQCAWSIGAFNRRYGTNFVN